MDYKGNVTVKIDGIAASAASVIAMAGNKVLMSPVSMLMIHNPMTVTMGDTSEMQKAIEMLSEVRESIMDANKAVELGFADDILQRTEPAPDQTADSLMYSETQVVNFLMGRIAEKCRIQPKQTNITKADELLSQLDLIKDTMS